LGHEIQAAVQAFNDQMEYQPIFAYVTRWDRTLQLREDRPAIAEDIVGLRLDDIVYLVFRGRPNVFAPPRHYLPMLVRQFEEDRNRLRTGGAQPREHFGHAFRRHAASYNIVLPADRDQELVEWVYSNPNRCPGMRLHHETYRELMLNLEN